MDPCSIKINNNVSFIFVKKFLEERILTSLCRAVVAVPRPSGSIERRDSIRGSEGGGKSWNVSATQRLYGCCGLKSVAFGNLYFFQ